MKNLEEIILEFRVPISPTPAFFAQVRAFDFALGRLGRPYSNATLLICVGDDCDIDAVGHANPWSSDRVKWEAVPPDVFAEFGIHGTADWRLAREVGNADIVILSDADTVLLKDIDPLLKTLPDKVPAVRGHMAHLPPPSTGGGLPPSDQADYWPALFALFGVKWPQRLFSYSMDIERRLPQIPAYYNLGFVALNRHGLAEIQPRIFDMQRRFHSSVVSHMRCQIAVSLLAYQLNMDIDILPAAYNAANDTSHLDHNYLSAADIRVLHYLRTEEIDRSLIFQDGHFTTFLDAQLENPANRALQAFAESYRRSRQTTGLG